MDNIVSDNTLGRFDREFRLRILSLCLNNRWMNKYGNFIIKPEYFEQDDEESFVKSVLEYRMKFGKSPRDPVDVIAMNNGKYNEFITDIYDNLEEWDTSLAEDYAITFAREQAVKVALLDSVDEVLEGNIQAVIPKLTAAIDVGKDIESPGIDLIGDVDKWLYDYWSGKVRTGWIHIDKILEGGLSPGEEGIILSPSNRGKSMALINLGYCAASIGSGKNVVHISHEMSQSQVAKRYAARMVFRFPKPGDNLDDYSEELYKAARRLLVGKIRIVGGAGKMNMLAVENVIKKLIEEDFAPGEIIDDYIDKVEPMKHYNEKRYELSSLYEWYRQLSDKYGCPVWSASQSNRHSYSKELISQEDIAEDIGKATIADVIIALCQTDEEEMVNQCRLYMAKVRDGHNRSVIQAKYYREQQAIVTTRVMDMSDKKKKEVAIDV